jgi:predicted nucleic acid-binding protein
LEVSNINFNVMRTSEFFNHTGTLRILLEAKSQGITPHIAPHIDELQNAGMWISQGIRQRILALAGEDQCE